MFKAFVNFVINLCVKRAPVSITEYKTDNKNKKEIKMNSVRRNRKRKEERRIIIS